MSDGRGIDKSELSDPCSALGSTLPHDAPFRTSMGGYREYETELRNRPIEVRTGYVQVSSS